MPETAVVLETLDYHEDNLGTLITKLDDNIKKVKQISDSLNLEELTKTIDDLKERVEKLEQSGGGGVAPGEGCPCCPYLNRESGE